MKQIFNFNDSQLLKLSQYDIMSDIVKDSFLYSAFKL